MTEPAPPPSPTGAFDVHHPPSAERVADCVHCGFCLPSCPTYVLWGEEMDSPRGRIHLVKLALEGEAAIDAGFRQHFDNCLGCMACLTSCPSGVQYDAILEAARPQLERIVPRSSADRWFRWFLLALFPHRFRLRLAATAAWLARVTGLRAAVRASGLNRALPENVRALEALAPDVDLKPAWAGLPAPAPVASPRARVALLEGCVQSVFFPAANAATVKVLGAERVQVVPVAGQGCCGALELHAGADQSARRRVRRLIERFDRAGVDRVLVNAAGCGSMLKTADRLFEGDPFLPTARRFVDKVNDVLEFLHELGPEAELRPLGSSTTVGNRATPTRTRVAYHDACHLAHAQGVRTAPRALLRRIPELQLEEIPDPEICCGSAGIYNLVQPGPAAALGERKARDVARIAPDVLAAATPGCLLQIRRHLDAGIRIAHPIELLAEALHGDGDHSAP